MARPPIDFYTPYHKGIRRRLFALAVDAGRLDTDDEAAVTAHAAQLAEALGTLRRHAQYEDRYFHPLLAQSRVAQLSWLAADHDAQEPALVHLEQRFAAVGRAPAGDARRAEALVYYRVLSRYLGDLMLHLDLEEREAMPRLRSNHSEEELEETWLRFLHSLSPAEMAETAALVLPALSPPEQYDLLAPVLRGGSEEMHAAVGEAAERAIGPDAWAHLAARIAGDGADAV